MRADAPVRSLVLWFPDWPVTAWRRAEDLITITERVRKRARKRN